MPEDFEYQPACPACGGPGGLLGGLGRLTWFRCRDCGIDFNKAKEGDNE